MQVKQWLEKYLIFLEAVILSCKSSTISRPLTVLGLVVFCALGWSQGRANTEGHAWLCEWVAGQLSSQGPELTAEPLCGNS